MDSKTPNQRHNNMAAIRGKDTKPELVVRKYLWSHGFRYRLNYARLSGKPDIVLRMYRTCIFVNGCFWHGHEDCRYYTVPKTRTEFWVNKVQRNKQRDAAVIEKLTDRGWNCITIWECQLKPAVRDATLQSLVYTLSQILLRNQKPRRYALPDEESEAPRVAADTTEIAYTSTPR